MEERTDKIVYFVLGKFITGVESELARNFTEAATSQMEQLYQLIWKKFHGITEVETALLTAVEERSTSDFNRAVEYLQKAMNEDPQFANDIRVLVQQISASIIQDASALKQIDSYNFRSEINKGIKYELDVSTDDIIYGSQVGDRTVVAYTRYVRQRQDFVKIPVFFATDRKQKDKTSPKKLYGGKRNQTGDLEFGLATVSIPHDHRMGNLERPKLWTFERSEDPTRHVMLLDVKTFGQDKFLTDLRESLKKLKKSDAPDLLVFIHGYNTSFKDAVRRTAQITYDLKFPGQAILYSWPSEANFLHYTTDENNIEWTIPHLEKFLLLLLTATNARAVNAIAHSMGNRALARAINNLDRSQLPQEAAILRHIVFAAPDIDADTFRDFAKEFHKKAERFTLYASSQDKALRASKVFHGGYPRAGDSGQKLVIVDGIDSIDASQVNTDLLGHSYFSDNRSILSDIFYLLKHSLPPDKRAGLLSRTLNNLRFWLFQP
ncbi:alpha/beta hydrolase [Cylindrospermum stagnale]|nr:alpha/beta hydrolase [Cylindrospermum stagnale]